MTLQRPTLPELYAQTQSDLESRLEGADASMPRSNIVVLSKVIAFGLYGVYGNISFLAKQLFASTSEDEFLEQDASEYDLYKKLPGVAFGPTIATGTEGMPIPAGLTLVRSDQVSFVTTAAATIVAGVASVPLAATQPGTASNTPAGATLTFQNAPTGIAAATAVGSDGIAGGTDLETGDELQARLLERKRQPPQGGADADYEEWASSVPGVTRVWVLPNWLGLGTVGVTFVMDDQAGSIIPDAATVALVQAAIDALRPVTAKVTVFAPVELPLDVVAHLDPDAADTRTQAEENLAAVVAADAIPNGTLKLSHLRSAVESAAGDGDGEIVSPAANVVPGPGQIVVLNSVSWV